ncbi:MAG: hypothetical protein GU343_01070 [Nanoarchaeota archaeon]|jgi:hypothetical protein|nr:hypothetical protein [Nanoarchaeota archaeon]
MSKYRYNLDRIIDESFEEVIEYFNKEGIIKREPLLIKENSFFNIPVMSTLSAYAVFAYNEISNMLKYHTFYVPISLIMWSIPSFWVLWRYKYSYGVYIPVIKVIYTMKNTLKMTIDKLLDALSSKNISGPSIISLKPPELGIVAYPVYTDRNNLEKDIPKAIAKIILIHEVAHSIIGISEWKASTLEYSVYFYKNFYKNDLYKYPEVYKIIKRNIEKCKAYIEEEKKPNPYSIGLCYANIIICKHQSTELNIKDIIKEIKYLSKKDVINIIKSYNIN